VQSAEIAGVGSGFGLTPLFWGLLILKSSIF
jgi:hypothetical protein